MFRLFTALRPPPPIRERLGAIMTGVPGARWQDDAQLHLTLRFVGEVERAQAEDIAAALAHVRTPAIEIALAGVGRFANALWAGVTPHDALAALHKKVDRALSAVGVEQDRRAYLPHVTLARTRRGATALPEAERWLADHAGLASPAFTLTHLVLYQSTLGSEGAHYEAITRWLLT